jgi:hypothetical protein
MSLMLCAHSELEKGKFPKLQKCVGVRAAHVVMLTMPNLFCSCNINLSCNAIVLGQYLELEGAHWLNLKLFGINIDSTTKGGRITNMEGAACVAVIDVVIFFAPVILYPVMPSLSVNIWS